MSSVEKPLVVEKTTEGVINFATFNCAEDKTIQAIFFKNGVELTLSDGRNMFISQVVSASGTRYANTGESFVFWNKGDTAFVEENNKITFNNCLIFNNLETSAKTDDQIQAPAQIANPASVNCSKLGGNLVFQKRGDGGEYGICLFEDNRQCEEWSLLRGDCPVGGLKIAGYENNAEIFCVITGGKIEGLGTGASMCKRTDGTLCAVQANFNGECPDPNAGNSEAQ